MRVTWVIGFAAAVAAQGQELPNVVGWRIAQPTPGTHVAGTALTGMQGGEGAGVIHGSAADNGARGAFIQEFYQQTAIPAGRRYRWSVSYRTIDPLEGRGAVLIDCYTKEGEQSHKGLVSQSLAASPNWRTVGGEVTVPEGVVRTRMLLYLHGQGTIWFDDVFFGDPEEGAANQLRNGGFEPPASARYDRLPPNGAGRVKLSGGFPNGALGSVKEIGPDEFYLYTVPAGQAAPPFLWFHFRVDGCAGREVTFHLNPAPFDRERTGGNGTRLPLVSEDGDHWRGVTDKSWNEDGTVLTCRVRFTREPAWIASFFPYSADRVARRLAEFVAHPHFRGTSLGQTRLGGELPAYTITDPAVPAADKRVVLFTALQHDLETTGALALEGLTRFILSDDPRAVALRRAFEFHIVPRMDPDGIDAGNRYHPAGNLNRQWGLGTAPETGCVERLAKSLVAAGRPLALTIDFHGWCTPARETLFLTFGRELTDEATEAATLALAETIKPRLTGKVSVPLRRQMVSRVTGGETDLRRLASGWLKFEAGAHLSYTIEIFGEGEAEQDDYLAWGQAIGEGIAEYYGRGGG